MSNEILHGPSGDGIDRRGFLKCMAWAGPGAFCVIKGGVLESDSLSEIARRGMLRVNGELAFVQISDRHIGFDKPANPDVVATLEASIEKINALAVRPTFVLHTGDLTHLSKPSEFDTLAQALNALKTECSTFPGSTTCSTTTAGCISSAMAKARGARAGTASTTAACISRAWSTW
jgi:Icc protein